MTSGMPSNISPNHWTNLKEKFSLSLIVLLFAFTNISAQSPLVQHFTTSEGLPSNEVYRIFQDSKKFIWFATDAGVARYDGSKFYYYRKQDGLSSNDIFNISEDSSGRIWFFHNNSSSLNYFYSNSIHNEKNTPFLALLNSSDKFNRFYEDNHRNINFYFHKNCLIFTLDSQNQVAKYQLPSIRFRNITNQRNEEGMVVLNMKKDSNGDFIIWTPSGCYQLKSLSDTPIQLNRTLRYKDILTSSNNKKYAIVRETDSLKFRIKRLNEETVVDKSEPLVNMDSRNICSILEDNNGYLWISTLDDGVFCFRGKEMLYHFDIKDARSLIQDHENNIWIGSMKEGVYKISPFFIFHQHLDKTTFQNSGIFALSNHDSTGIWCTNGQLIYLLKDKDLFQVDFKRSDKAFNQLLEVNNHLLMVGEVGKTPYALHGYRISQTEKKIYINSVKKSPVTMRKIIYNRQKNQISSFDQIFLFLNNADHVFDSLKMYKTKEKIFGNYYNINNDLIIDSKKLGVFRGKTKEEYKELSYFNNRIVSDHLNLNEKTELFNIEGDSLFLYSNKQLFNLSAAFEQPIDMQIKQLVYHDSTLFIATSRNIYVCKNPLNILKKEPVLLNLIDINFNSIHGILF